MGKLIAWNCECGEKNSGREGQPLLCKKCGRPWGPQPEPETEGTGHLEAHFTCPKCAASMILRVQGMKREPMDFELECKACGKKMTPAIT